MVPVAGTTFADRGQYRCSVIDVQVRTIPFGSPEARALLDAAVAELARRYDAPGDETPISAVEFAPPAGDFLFATADGEPAGCGGWRSCTDNPGDAEIKRMYTLPAFRGRGVGRAVLRAIEDSARASGKRRAILETGLKQPEAIAFYGRCGYERISNFGYYRDHPGCVSFGRDL
jgi:GNAT superfamily N-acetyltransferase